MSEWCDNQKQSSSDIRQLPQERIEKTNLHSQLNAEEKKRLNKLEAIAAQLKREENRWSKALLKYIL